MKQQLWQLFHDQSRSPSTLSEASTSSSCFSLDSLIHDPAFEFSSLGSSSRLQRALRKLVLISDFSPAFRVNNLHLASAELLGRGTFGSTYAAAMDNGVTIVVKRLKLVSISELEFKRNMDIVASVSHENVAALRAYYSSKKERLMLYDYYNNGSVFALLHGQNRAHVDWETRLRIAIGAARGIAEIHKQNGGKLVHGNIKSSNILLDMQHYGCVSDLGLANMIETTFMPNSQYHALEVNNTQHVSQASDVYSFGILLLELLTRKSTEHLPGGPEPIDLVRLVGSVKSKERATKVFDTDLLKHPTISKGMVEMLQIGINCVSKSIKKRPKISEVVKMLDDIGRMNPGGKLAFVEGVIPMFDLDHMLEASAWVHGRGTFGSCFMVRLENGNTIVVKGLNDVLVTFMEFQQHMEVAWRMRHENIAGLLVYDYYSWGSVSAALHGTNRTPLDWETRLKIAVGAARGITHIHRQDGRKLVHGNIKSSNVLINGKKYGIVSDGGLAKLVGPKRLLGMPNCAPEVKDTWKLSQAGDVYSFGVVLLELITGKQSQVTMGDGQAISLGEWIQSHLRDEWSFDVCDVQILKRINEEAAILQLLQIAMSCVAVVPEHRPRMPEILKMLEEISGLDPSDELSLDGVLEETLEQPSIESMLENLLEDLLPTLTP
ncbi:Serine/threonine protein kinase [Handroanthus impetiginosus]|uniref:Serine/threonine protein kinase n=1 Tax=Handroanthus impetiginosus TaxID=429701 RepID=A0A2G9GFF3_9LAMI|nr:Serine/threonine protein kinase [Handroanthus impetiginosus]